MAGRLCIPRNPARSQQLPTHEDYFAEVPTNLPHLLRRRYRMCKSIFIRIVGTCEQTTLIFFTQRRNAPSFLGFSSYQNI